MVASTPGLLKRLEQLTKDNCEGYKRPYESFFDLYVDL